MRQWVLVLFFTVNLVFLGTCKISAEEIHKLTLKECIRMALDSNLDLKSASFGPLQAQTGVQNVQSLYDPVLRGVFGHRDANEPQISSVFGTKSETTESSLNIIKKLGYGGSASFSLEQERFKSNSFFQTLNPSYRSLFTASLRQPITRNFLGREDKAFINAAFATYRASQNKYRSTMEETIDKVHRFYWSLALAREDQSLSQRAVEEAQDLKIYLTDRRRLGLAQETEILAAEAAVESREAELLLAKDTVEQLKEELVLLLGHPKLNIRPSEILEIEPIVSPDERKNQSIAQRPDLQAMKQEIKVLEETLKKVRESKKPDLSLDGSITYTGLSGDYGDDMSSVFQMEHPTWFLGATFRWPLFGRSGQAEFDRTAWLLAEKRFRLKSLEDEIRKNMTRALTYLQIQYQRLERIEKAKQLHQKKLEIGHKRFRIGRVDAYRLIDFQREFRQSERVLLLAYYDYRRAQLVLERETGQLLRVYNP